MYSLEGSNLVSVRTKYEKCRNVQKVKCNWSFGRKPQPTRWTLHVVVNFYITSLPLHKHIYIYIHETRMGHRKTYCPQKKHIRASLFSQQIYEAPCSGVRFAFPSFPWSRTMEERMNLSRFGERPWKGGLHQLWSWQNKKPRKKAI